jgi:hypothetical protein
LSRSPENRADRVMIDTAATEKAKTNHFTFSFKNLTKDI